MHDDSKRYDGKRHEGPSHSSPYPVSRLAPVHDLVDMAREIERAHSLVSTVAGSKLQIIADQIQALQAQARQILEKAERDVALHQATCTFQKRPGHVYHLYRKPDGSAYLSMLSADEWAGHPPHTYEGSFRLEADQSWTETDRMSERPTPGRGPKRLNRDPGDES